MGSGGSKQVQTLEKSDPWAGQQPYLLDLFARAQQQSEQPAQYFPQSTVAPQSQATLQGQQEALHTAQGALGTLGLAGTKNALFNLGPAMDVSTNPYLQSAIAAAQRPVIQQFTDPGGPLSQARTQFVDTGGYGGSRHALTESVLGGRLSQTLGDISSTLASRGYETGLDAAIRQQALLPQTQAAALAPATTMSQVGAQQDAYQQQLLSDMVSRWNFEQGEPWQRLGQYGGLIQGNLGSQTTSTAPGAATNPLLGAAGGAVAGAGTGAAIGSAYTPYGAAIGALLGYLASR